MNSRPTIPTNNCTSSYCTLDSASPPTPPPPSILSYRLSENLKENQLIPERAAETSNISSYALAETSKIPSSFPKNMTSTNSLLQQPLEDTSEKRRFAVSHAHKHSILSPSSSPDSSKPPANRSSKRSSDDYAFGSILGEGSLARVYLASSLKTGEEVAIKVIQKNRIQNSLEKEQVFSELSVLKKVRHPNIIKLLHTFQDNLHLYFVLEMGGWVNMEEHLARHGGVFSIEVARFYTGELVSVCNCLRRNGVAHRDMKTHNILINSSGRIKLIDFNHAKFFREDDGVFLQNAADSAETSSSQDSVFVGTSSYVPPEALSGAADISYPADLWSLGCIVYRMLVGVSPFYHRFKSVTYKKIKNLQYEIPPHIDTVTQDFIRKLLVKDPSQRLGVKDPRDITNHPFVSGYDVDFLHLQPLPREVVHLTKNRQRRLESDSYSMDNNELDRMEFTPSVGESFPKLMACSNEE